MGARQTIISDCGCAGRHRDADREGAAVPGAALQEACRQARAWQDLGLPAIPIAVNVSALQFQQPEFVEGVAAALRAAARYPFAGGAAWSEADDDEGVGAAEGGAFARHSFRHDGETMGAFQPGASWGLTVRLGARF